MCAVQLERRNIIASTIYPKFKILTFHIDHLLTHSLNAFGRAKIRDL